MKVFKFGGASVKDAEGVRNVATVLRSEGFQSCLLIVSAMGKTTNALENIVQKYTSTGYYAEDLLEIEQYHLQIAKDLFAADHLIFHKIKGQFQKIQVFLDQNILQQYNYIYDQVVSFGELISSQILSGYLNESGFANTYLDARRYIETDENYREGNVNWLLTEQNIAALDKNLSYVTQGFIAAAENGNTTTLGREGSDYSAAIFSSCLSANALTIWKDVPGVMTGDPRKFDNVRLLSQLSYEEAIEMAYYGASIIHPKTLQPLKQKNIPFYVKSFFDPSSSGTKVGKTNPNKPEETYILKEKQVLMHISTKDFSFIAENHIGMIFNMISQCRIKVSVMQNSAISLALCLEDAFQNIDLLKEQLCAQFMIETVENVSLFTIRNIDLHHSDHFYKDKEVLLKQISNHILQIIAK